MIIGFGCEKTEEVVAPSELAPPTNLRAVSDDVSVTLYWDLSSSEGDSKFQGYRIMVYDGSTLKDSSQVSKGVYSKRVDMSSSAFFYQVNYTFKVHSVSNGSLSQAATIVWGKSKKSATDKTIYEFASPNPSGLSFINGTNPADPAGGLLSFKAENANQLDLWIDGRNNADVLLKSPHKYGSPMTRVTQLAEATPAQGSGSVTNLTTPTFPPSSFQDTPGLVPLANKVYWAKTQDGYYVRFMVVATGGTSPNRFVTIRYFINDGGGAWAKRGSN